MNRENDLYKSLRKEMVEYQIKARGIRDKRVLDAMLKIKRHKFVPDSVKHSAYDDCPLPVLEGQTISQPYIVALMTSLLKLKGNEKVLEIGAGSGYQAAILSILSKEVITIERKEKLFEFAKKNLKDFKNVKVVLGDGTIGYKKKAPYDRIIVAAAAPDVSDDFLEQLADNGIMVIPVGDRTYQTMMIYKKVNGKIKKEKNIECVFVPLIGKKGWSE